MLSGKLLEVGTIRIKLQGYSLRTRIHGHAPVANVPDYLVLISPPICSLT